MRNSCDSKAMSQQVVLIVTGFGQFSGVVDNPSMRIVEALQDQEFASMLSVKCLFYNLEVSVDACNSFIRDMDEIKDSFFLFLHIGVHHSSESLRLEGVAYNTMNFRVPDQSGFQPLNDCIDPSVCLGNSLGSSLALGTLCAKLNNSIGSTTAVALSSDAGRFLCNYIFYKSLMFLQKKGQPETSLFLHIPPFETIEKAVQIDIVKKLCVLLTESLS